jgi:transposase-like protein
MKTTNHHNEDTINLVMQLLSQNGLEGMPALLRILLNETMKMERSEALGAGHYERSDDRKGYANGFKPKTVNTRVGKVTVQIPQVRGMEFYPQCLEKGIRSERALKCAIAEMYISGVSTRKVADITRELCGLDVTSIASLTVYR